MTTDTIIKLAFELGSAIAQSEEITQLRDTQVRVSQNKEAYDLIMRFQEAHTQTENKLMDGLPITKAEESHLSILEQQLNSNPMIQELMKAQDKFDSLMQGVYFAMNQAITGGNDCSSGCSSCGETCGS
ncbi:MAG TPA: YlbF family regulator [Syntrophomonadaceae bacterium]|nr:YlbF family regulator [Syntrophomonadaceae bacterium]